MADNSKTMAANATGSPIATPTSAKQKQAAIRFNPPAYRGKADEKTGTIRKPYIAEAVVLGLFGAKAIQLAGFMLQRDGNEIVVHTPFTSKTWGGVSAVQPEMRHISGELRTQMIQAGFDVGDRSVTPVAGGAADVESLLQAIRDAWVECTDNGKSAPQWNADIALRY